MLPFQLLHVLPACSATNLSTQLLKARGTYLHCSPSLEHFAHLYIQPKFSTKNRPNHPL